MKGLRIALSASALLACATQTAPPRGQLLFYMTTDAPLPPAGGAAAPLDEPMPLFDRMRLEVLAPGEDTPCDGCTHEFALDRDLVGGGKASVGLALPIGVAGYRARVRMFRTVALVEGAPDPQGTVDATFALPAVAQDAITEITAMLGTDDVGTRRGQGAPLAPVQGRPAPGTVGSWWGAARVPCSGDPGPDEVCIPGGAFWMGDRAVRLLSGANGEPEDGSQRIVVLSPFFLGQTEVTAGAYRASGLPPVRPPAPDNNCVYTGTAGANEGLPLNCIGWYAAQRYCRKRGGDLPTEAQLEYVMSGMRSLPFVWGQDPPRCGDVNVRHYQICLDSPDMLRPPGSGARDRFRPPGASDDVVDLAGNLYELARDTWQPLSGSCWAASLLQDPVCTVTSADRAVRGAGYNSDPAQSRAAFRTYVPATADADETGFRCARPAN